MDPEAPNTAWPPVLRTIQTYLDTLEHELTAHMDHNTVDLCAFDLLPPDPSVPSQAKWPPYKQRVDFGSEIGPSLYLVDYDRNELNSGFGTFGGYVQIRTTTNPGWTRYALTNFHVIRPCFYGFQFDTGKKKDGKAVFDARTAPRQESSCWKADSKGFGPSKPAQRRGVESPSRRTHNLAVRDVEKVVEGYRVRYPHHLHLLQPYHGDLERRIAFFDEGQNELGFLWAGSGLSRRSGGNQRLDWALIRVRED